MNRRGFIKSLGLAVAAFSVLPAATTYERKWKYSKESGLWCPNPEWINAPYEVKFMYGSAIDPKLLECPPPKLVPMIYSRTDVIPPGFVEEALPIRYDENFKVVAPYVRI